MFKHLIVVYVVIACLVLQEAAKLFSRVAVPFYFPTAMNKWSSVCTFLSALGVCHFFILAILIGV